MVAIVLGYKTLGQHSPHFHDEAQKMLLLPCISGIVGDFCLVESLDYSKIINQFVWSDQVPLGNTELLDPSAS